MGLIGKASMWPGLKKLGRKRVTGGEKVMAVGLLWSPVSSQCLLFFTQQ